MRLCFIICLSFLLNSCNQINKNKIEAERYLPNKFASHFSFQKSGNIIYLKVINPYQGAVSDTFTYTLSESSCKNCIRIPIKKAVIFSTTYIGFLNAIKELNTIKAVSGSKFIYNPMINEEIAKGNISDIGFESSIDFEKLITIKPDVVFIYSVGKESMPYVKKIESLGIPVIYVAEFMEESPLGRAEWIKFFSLFFDKENLADSIFSNINKKYDSISSISKNNYRKPKVFLNIPDNGIWYLPNGNSYMANLIKNAGGDYIYSQNTNGPVLKYDFERVYSNAITCDIWLNQGVIKKKSDLKQLDKRFEKLPSFKSGKLYNHCLKMTSDGGNDFWESGVVSPHLILEDLYHIFKDDSLFSFHYYQKLK